MKADPVAPYFPWFLILWFAFGAGSWLWIATRPTAENKRLWHRRICITAGILFGAFITFTLVSWGQLFALLIFLPGIVKITYLNLKFTFFCDSCRKTSFSQAWFSSGYYCPNCGHKIR
jgi:hypothetical protein